MIRSLVELERKQEEGEEPAQDIRTNSLRLSFKKRKTTRLMSRSVKDPLQPLLSALCLCVQRTLVSSFNSVNSYADQRAVALASLQNLSELFLFKIKEAFCTVSSVRKGYHVELMTRKTRRLWDVLHKAVSNRRGVGFLLAWQWAQTRRQRLERLKPLLERLSQIQQYRNYRAKKEFMAVYMRYKQRVQKYQTLLDMVARYYRAQNRRLLKRGFEQIQFHYQQLIYFEEEIIEQAQPPIPQPPPPLEFEPLKLSPVRAQPRPVVLPSQPGVCQVCGQDHELLIKSQRLKRSVYQQPVPQLQPIKPIQAAPVVPYCLPPTFLVEQCRRCQHSQVRPLPPPSPVPRQQYSQFLGRPSLAPVPRQQYSQYLSKPTPVPVSRQEYSQYLGKQVAMTKSVRTISPIKVISHYVSAPGSPANNVAYQYSTQAKPTTALLPVGVRNASPNPEYSPQRLKAVSSYPSDRWESPLRVVQESPLPLQKRVVWQQIPAGRIVQQNFSSARVSQSERAREMQIKLQWERQRERIVMQRERQLQRQRQLQSEWKRVKFGGRQSEANNHVDRDMDRQRIWLQQSQASARRQISLPAEQAVWHEQYNVPVKNLGWQEQYTVPDKWTARRQAITRAFDSEGAGLSAEKRGEQSPTRQRLGEQRILKVESSPKKVQLSQDSTRILRVESPPHRQKERQVLNIKRSVNSFK